MFWAGVIFLYPFLINNAFADPSLMTMRVWFDAFIDPVNPTVKDFSHITSSGTKVISAPDVWAPPGFDIKSLKGTCFSTDERSFDPSPTASARGRVDFLVLFQSRRQFTIQNSPGRDALKFVGVTRNVDCKTGTDLRAPASADISGIAIGDVKQNGFLKLFNVRASIGDPFYKILSLSVAPKLDFEFVYEYSITKLSVRIYGSTGTFPSFEGYYQINGGKIVNFLKRPPADGATPLSLFDFGLGINTENFEYVIDLKPYLLPE
jgi:hypothetical protein